MSETTMPDPQQLRADIELQRAQLGDTVQQLAAKADVRTRAKQALGDVTDNARQKLVGVKEQAAQAVDTAKTKAAGARQQLADSDLPVPLRRPLPWAVIAVAAVALVATAVVVTRRRGA